MKGKILLLAGALLSSFMSFSQYCTTGLYTTGCSVGDDIDDFALANLTQTATGCPSGVAGFSDYTGDTINMQIAVQYLMSASTNFNGQGLGIWVDFNDDQDWDDPGEFIYGTNAFFGPTLSDNVIIPVGSTVGNHRMRVRAFYNQNPAATDACSTTLSQWGEAHDYTVNVLPAPACAPPFNVVQTGASPNSVIIAYQGTTDTVNIEYGAVGFTQGAGTTVSGIVGNPATLGSLMAQSSYDVYIQLDCGTGGLSTWSGPFTVFTACNPVTAPYTEDFDNATNWVPGTGAQTGFTIDQCWNADPSTPAAAAFQWSPRTVAPGSGNGPLQDFTGGSYLYCEASFPAAPGDTARITSPAIDVSGLTNPSLFFQQHRFGGGTIADMSVDVSNDFGVSWTNVYNVSGDIQTSAADAWQEEFINLGGFVGDTILIRFTQASFGCCGDAAIDSVVVDEAPPCPRPGNLQVSGTTSSSALLTWLDPTNSTWDVEYGTPGFALGTGTSVTANSNPFTLPSLTPGTVYEVYIRANCTASANGTSQWVGPVSFATSCLTVNTFPYSDDMDGSTWVNSTAFNNVGDSIDVCWSRTPLDAGNNYFWGVRTGGSPGFQTGPNTDRSGTGKYIYTTSGNNGVNGATAYITLPDFDLTSLTSPEFTFWYHMFGNSTGTINLQVSTDTGQTWTTVRTYVGQQQTAQTDPWLEAIVDITPYKGPFVKLRFEAIKGANFGGGDMAVDDVLLQEAPLCPKPQLVSLLGTTDTSVTMTWLSTNSAFDVEWGPIGFSQGTGTLIQVSNDTSTVNGLSPNTCYDFFVRSNCSGAGNGSSVWVGPYTYCTACTPVTTFPFSESFDANGLNCWTVIDGNSDNTFWELDTVAANARSGQNSASLNFPFGGVPDEWMISPKITLTGNQRFSIWAKDRFGGFGSSEFAVFLSTTDDQTSSFTDTIVPPTNLNTNIYNEYKSSLTAYTGDVYIAIYASNSTGPFFGTAQVDDLLIEDVPACLEPDSVQLLSATPSSATFDWAPGGGTTWNMEVGPTGFTPGLGAPQVATTNTGTIGSLTPNTTYDFYVQSDCGAGSVSVWVGPFTFTTPCLAVNMPYYESFDLWPLSCWDDQGGSQFWTQFISGTGDDYAEANFWSFNGDSMVLTSLPVVITADAQVRFDWSHLYNATYPDDALIVMAKTLSANSWDTILHLEGPNNFNDPTAGNFNSPGQFITEEIILDPVKYTGDTIQVRLWADSDWGPDLYVNEFYIEAAPTCPKLISQSISNLVDTSVTLNWATSNVATQYQVWFGPQGFFQGTQTSGAGVMSLQSGTSLLVDTLTSNSCYEFLVRAICQPGDTSQWIGPVSFCTPCNTFTAPFFENFENNTLGHFDGEDNCWSLVNTTVKTTATSGYGWELRNSVQTSSGGTGASGDRTLYPAIGGQFWNADVSYGGTGDSSMLISPLIDVSGLSNPELGYSIHRFGTNMADLYVDVYDGTTWTMGIHSYTNTTGVQTANADPWTDTIISLVPYVSASNLIQVRFRTVSNGCCPGDNGLDEVRISDPVTCFQPTTLSASNITTTTADLSWLNGGGGTGTSFQISYGMNISSPDSGTMQLATGTSATVTSLMSSSQYCYYVREICAPSDTSIWGGPYCFQTLCTAAIAPWTEDFENHSLGHYDGSDNCWDLINTAPKTSPTSGYGWELRNAVQTSSGGTGASGDNTLYPAVGGQFWNADVSYGAAGDSSMLVSPLVDVSGLTTPVLEYHVHRFGTNMADLYVDIWDGATWTMGVHAWTSATGAQTASADPWTDTTISLVPYVTASNIIQVRFRTVSNGCCPGDNGLDDVSITDAAGPSCPDPGFLSAQATTCDTAIFSWASSGSTISSVVEWGPAGFVPGTGAGTIVTNATSPLTISGTSANTGYDFYVVDICATDTSNIVGPSSWNSGNAGAPVANIGTPTVNGPTLTDQTVDFDGSASTGAGNTYAWDFGDGNTGSGSTVSHSFTSDSTWTVTLIVTNACGSDTATTTVTTAGISIQENVLSRSLKVFPNPAATSININFNSSGAQEAVIRLLDLSGKEVLRSDVSNLNGSYQGSLDITGIAEGMYMLEIESGELRATHRVIKQ